MKVFSTCMKIIKRNKMQSLTYLLVFLALCIGMALMGNRQTSADFQGERPEYTVIDRDEKNALTEGMKETLEKKGTCVELEDDEKTLQDALFYEKTSMILIIPEGFAKSQEKGEKAELQMVKGKNMAKGYYLENIAEQYWSQVQLLRNVHPNWESGQIAEQAVKDMETEVKAEKISIEGTGKITEVYEAYNRVEGYILMVLLVLLISQIQLTFRKPEIRMRNLISPMRAENVSIQMAFHGLVTGLGVWLMITGLGILLFAVRTDPIPWKTIGLFAANGFCLMIVSMAFALFIGNFVQSINGMNMAANFSALFFGFLGGVFVPAELMSDQMLSIGKLFPTYWYTENVAKISGLMGFDRSSLWPVLRNYGIQLAFAAAVFSVAVLLGKYRSMGEEEYGLTETEVE